MNQLEREEKLAQALKMAQQAEEKARQASEFADAISRSEALRDRSKISSKTM